MMTTVNTTLELESPKFGFAQAVGLALRNIDILLSK